MPQDEDDKANHCPKEGYPEGVAIRRMRNKEDPEDEFLEQGRTDGKVQRENNKPPPSTRHGCNPQESSSKPNRKYDNHEEK